jgi:CelD/BcsL family acetyltransferase involved in cellulose biosynthesis
MNNSIRIEFIHEMGKFENLREAWDYLLSHSTPRDVFLTWEWLSAWWKSYSDGKQLYLVTAWREEELIGMAPLMLVRQWENGLPLRVLHTLGAPNSDVSHFLARDDDPQILQALCNAIKAQSSRWDAIELNEFQSNLPQTKFIMDYFEQAGFQVYPKVGLHYHIPIQSTWDEYFRKLSKNLRHNLQRRLRRVEEAGTYQYLRVKGHEITWDHFETIFQINEKSHYPEVYRTEKDRAFHREILERMRGREWVEIHLFFFNEKAIAYQYGFEFDERYEDWRGGFDQSYPQLSIGKLLMSLTTERHFNSNYKDIDFLRGVHEYKLDWASCPREFLEIRIVAPQHIPAMLAFLWIPQFKRWLKRQFRKTKPDNEETTKDT